MRDRITIATLRTVLTGAMMLIASGNLCSQTSPPDRSLTREQYTAIGMPPIDSAWSSREFAIAVGILDSLARIDPTLLPRFESAASGELFARIVSPENVPAVVVATDSSALIELFTEMDGVSQSLKKLMPIYAQSIILTGAPGGAREAGINFDFEAVEVVAQGLHAKTSILSLYRQMLVKSDSFIAFDDPSNEFVGWTRRAILELVDLMGRSLLDPNLMRQPARLRMARHLEARLGLVMQLIEDSGITRRAMQLDKLKSVEQDPAVRAVLESIVHRLSEYGTNTKRN